MQNRYDFVYLFDVKDGNPNGDPDAGNLPRIDAETGQGLVTDVCIKRKIRNYVGLVKEEKPPFEIYVKEKAVLNNQHGRAWETVAPDVAKKDRKKMPKDVAKARELTDWMCTNFFDIRTFGAVMTTGENCGQVRGPVQFGMARSIDPIVASEHAVTRCAVTTEREAEKQEGDNRTMGRKFTVPYGLYRIHGYLNPHLASQTSFDKNEEDLTLFWSALTQMFETDRSASRGEMSPQALIVFKHKDALGNAPANKLFERVTICRNTTDDAPARQFADYKVTVDESKLPKGITIERKI
ncbi:MAG: type I-C CRISPR-associated protein Cas7/Csd2 [Fuerstiella sp.]